MIYVLHNCDTIFSFGHLSQLNVCVYARHKSNITHKPNRKTRNLWHFETLKEFCVNFFIIYYHDACADTLEICNYDFFLSAMPRKQRNRECKRKVSVRKNSLSRLQQKFNRLEKSIFFLLRWICCLVFRPQSKYQ